MTDRSSRSAIDQTGLIDERHAVPAAEGTDKLLLLEEVVLVSKREVLTGKVRVSTRMETREEVAEVDLDHDVVDVIRVPVGRVVEAAPAVRTEGDTTVVPVLEERFVVVKQLFLKEELHITRRVEHELTSVPVELRRQVAVVERLDPEGRAIRDDESFDA